MIIPASSDSFFKAFNSNLFLRPSCYSCRFARLPRIADISIADYWCWEKKKPPFFNTKGTNLVLVNNLKGKHLISESASNLSIGTADIIHATKYNPNIMRPTRMPNNYSKRKLIISALACGQLKLVFNKYL